MKSKIYLYLAAAALLTRAHGATYQWDTNGTTAGLGGAGAWNTTNTNWDLIGSGGDAGSDSTTAHIFTNADIARFAGTGATVNLSTTVNLNGLVFAETGYTLSGGTVTLAGTSPSITTDTGTATTISSVLAGTSGFTKTGDGSLTLTGASTLTGTIQINAGRLTLSGGGNRLATGASLVLGSGTTGATLVLSSADQKLTGLSTSGTGASYITATSGTNNKITISNDVNETLSATIGKMDANSTDNISLVKSGIGTLTLTATNTYTKGTTLQGGVLRLDYTNNNTSHLADGGGLTFSGGDLDLYGGSHTELVGAVSITGFSKVTRSSGTSILSMGSITRPTTSTGGGSLDIAANGIAKTSTTNKTGGILGYWITVGGNDLATNDGSGNIVAYTGYTNINRLGGSIVSNVTSNVAIVDGGTSGNITLAAAGTTTIYTLTKKGNETDATIDLTGKTLRLGGSSTDNNDGGGSILNGSTGGSMTFTGGTLTAGGTDNTAGTLTLINNDSGLHLITIASTIADNGTGAVTLAKYGIGTVRLTGANTHTGVTYMQQGTLEIGNVNALQNSTLDTGKLASPEVLFTVAGTNTYNLGGLQGTDDLAINANSINVGSNNASTSFGGDISGSGAINKLGSGTLTLTSATTHSGVITVNSGGLSLGNLNALQSSTLDTGNAGAQSVSFSVGGANTYNIGAIQGSDTLTLGNNSISVGANNATTAYNGVIEGAGGLTKVGSGKLTLTATNTYTGATAIDGGTLSVATIGNSGVSGNLGAGTSFTLGEATLQYTGATASTNRAYTLAEGLTGTIEVTASNATLTLTGSSTATSGSLVKTGQGTLALSGSNLHGGTTLVSEGTLALANINALQNTTLDTGTAGAQTVTFTVAGTNTYNLGGLQGADNLAIGSNSISVGANSASTTYSGVISGTGGLIKEGFGALALTGANTYSGTTRVDAGTLELGHVNALQNSTLDTGSTGGQVTLSAAGTNIYNIGGLQGSEEIALGDNTLSVGANNASTTYAGSLYGTGGLTKTGNGTLTLSGANTQQGATLITSGTVVTDSAQALGAGNVTVSTGATLQLGDTGSQLVTLGSGSTLVVNGTLKLNSNTSQVELSGGGGFNFTGGHIDLSGVFDGDVGRTTYDLLFGGTGTPGSVVISGYDTQVYSSVTLDTNGTLHFNATAIPEPSTFGLAGAGLLALGSAIRRRKQGLSS